MVQWIEICLPVERTWIASLVWEDSTCRRAAKAHVPRLLRPTCPRAHTLQQENPPQWEDHASWLDGSLRSLQLEKACVWKQRPWALQWRPRATINKLILKNHFKELLLAIGFEDELLAHYISFWRNYFKNTSYFNLTSQQEILKCHNRNIQLKNFCP